MLKNNVRWNNCRQNAEKQKAEERAKFMREHIAQRQANYKKKQQEEWETKYDHLHHFPECGFAYEPGYHSSLNQIFFVDKLR